ncbi:MAG: GTPase domain-containing protein [Oscillospiraceae bacterium]|jgi:small GTP-binding protein|nr:GTPase domain-containing protein [Oscillospiraceae bacterium]
MKFKKFMAQICTFAFMFSNLINVHAVDVNVVVLGDPEAGKTSVIDRMLRNTFRGNYCHTKMPESYPLQIGNYNVYVWDIPAEEQGAAQAYVGRLAMAAIVFDVTDPNSTKYIGKYVETIKTAYEGTPIFLVANKADRSSFEMCYDALDKGVEYGITYLYITSAKTGEGMEDLKEMIFRLANEIAEAEVKALNEVYAENNKVLNAIEEARTALIKANVAFGEAESNAANAKTPGEVEAANAALVKAKAEYNAARDVFEAKQNQWRLLGQQLMRRNRI